MRITRSVRIALVVLASGCGSRAMMPARDSEVRADMTAAAHGADRGDPNRAMWAVRTFDEKAGWLASQTKLTTTEGMWGERMAAAVSRQLDARRVNSTVIPKDVTKEQMNALYEQGLQYLCEGTISSIATADGNATLRVAYRLKRRVGEDTRTVQARGIEATTPMKAVDEMALLALVDTLAAKIADAVVADVPADLLAIRG